MIVLARLASAASVLGAAIRLTIADRVPFIATFFYVTPWLVLSIGSAVTAAMWLVLRRRAHAVLFAGLTILSAVLWLTRDRAWAEEQRRGEVRVVFWNAARPGPDISSAATALRRLDADVIALSEASSQYSRARAAWSRSFSDYDVRALPGGMMFFVRGKVRRQQFERFTDRSKVAVFEVELRGRIVTIVQVDVDPHVLRPRRANFRRIVRRIPAAGPVILLGDFNAPHDSAHFELIRRAGFHHTFLTKGRGAVATWPLPIPLLGIDHILVRDLTVRRADIMTLVDSDHRAVSAEIDLPASGAENHGRPIRTVEDPFTELRHDPQRNAWPPLTCAQRPAQTPPNMAAFTSPPTRARCRVRRRWNFFWQQRCIHKHVP